MEKRNFLSGDPSQLSDKRYQTESGKEEPSLNKSGQINDSGESTKAFTIRKLTNFYLLNERLFYANRNLVGWEPAISPGFNFIKPGLHGTVENTKEFEMNGESYKAVCTMNIDYGPIRGYRAFEIFRNGVSIINYAAGGAGHGGNFYKGKQYFIENDHAWLVERGYSLEYIRSRKTFSGLKRDDYFLFYFENIFLPEQKENNPRNGSFLKDRSYSADDIEPCRGIDWIADGIHQGHHIHIVSSSVNRFTSSTFDYEHPQFKVSCFLSVLDKTEFWIDSQMIEVKK